MQVLEHRTHQYGKCVYNIHRYGNRNIFINDNTYELFNNCYDDVNNENKMNIKPFLNHLCITICRVINHHQRVIYLPAMRIFISCVTSLFCMSSVKVTSLCFIWRHVPLLLLVFRRLSSTGSFCSNKSQVIHCLKYFSFCNKAFNGANIAWFGFYV